MLRAASPMKSSGTRIVFSALFVGVYREGEAPAEPRSTVDPGWAGASPSLVTLHAPERHSTAPRGPGRPTAGGTKTASGAGGTRLAMIMIGIARTAQNTTTPQRRKLVFASLPRAKAGDV